MKTSNLSFILFCLSLVYFSGYLSDMTGIRSHSFILCYGLFFLVHALVIYNVETCFNTKQTSLLFAVPTKNTSKRLGGQFV